MYDVSMTEASKSALVEVASSLSMYGKDLVLAGGWAPYFLTRGYFDHCGSKDIDLVLRPSIMVRYESIRQIVEELGYKETAKNPFRFEKNVRSPLDRKEYRVELDFLTEPSAAEQAYPLIRVQAGIKACLIKGSSIIFKFNYKENVEGVLPSDGKIVAELNVANIVGSLTMKGLALPRLSDKDAYDIYALTGFHMGSPKQASQEFLSNLNRVQMESTERRVISDSINMVRQAFRDPDSQGPYAVSRFTGQDIGAECHMRVGTFLEEIQSAFASNERI